MPCSYLGALAVVYFAVGPISLKKASLSARSALDNGGFGIETMLVTDDDGLRRVRRDVQPGRRPCFGTIESIGSAATRSRHEFVATRPVSSGAAAGSTAERWRNRSDPANVALRSLRAAKIDAIDRALRRFDRVIFLDADTFICRPIVSILGCAVEPPASVAFVPVDAGREHANTVLADSKSWRVPRSAREANTGVLAARNSTTTRALIAAWHDAYAELAAQSGFLMDQPAFRAALHATRAPYVFLDGTLNCRGHDRSTKRTSVALRCQGFDDLKGLVQTRLRGGAGCVILHSHDIREGPGDELDSGAATL